MLASMSKPDSHSRVSALYYAVKRQELCYCSLSPWPEYHTAKSAMLLVNFSLPIGFVRLVCLFAILSMLGCQFAPKKSIVDWPWMKTEAKTVPDRILPVWTDSVLHQPSQPGVRGFGGRVYFYGKENTEPIEVDGNFAVYVFDAEDSTSTNQKPLRKFVFTADQFKSHMSKTSMGPSYSVWIPWGEVGGPPRKLSLISRFEGREGGTTISDPTIKMLPGIPSNKEAAIGRTAATATNGNSTVSLAGHNESPSRSSTKDESDDTSGVESIDLPPAFQRHLRAPSTSIETLPTKQPKDESTTSLQRSADSVESIAAPVSTQVYDYRTRGRHQHSGSLPKKPTKSDIRKGRWIQSISRTDKPE